MEPQKQTSHRIRKRRWGVIVLASISTLASLTSFTIACSFFVAVVLNLEGPFRLRFFWFPMPWWLLQAIVAIAIGNSIWLFVFCVVSVSQLLKRKRSSGAQDARNLLMSPSRWHVIWYGSVIFLSMISPTLLNSSSSFVLKGKTELSSVAMVSPGEGWAVGNVQGTEPEGAPYGVIWQYHNGVWSQVAQLAYDFLNSVVALPDGEAWAVGADRTILHEQKGVWTLVHRNASDVRFESFSQVAMISSTEGWAVGSSLNETGPRGFIWQYRQGKWAPAFQFEKAGLWGISALPDGEAWAVGDGGTILHEREGIWSQVASPTQQDLTSISLVSSTEGWASGAQLLHFSDGKWTLSSQPSFGCPARIAMISAQEGWGIGANGHVFHYTRGIWQQVYTSPSPSLNAITVVSGTSSEGWIVGEGAIAETNTIPTPTILHMQHSTWSIISS